MVNVKHSKTALFSVLSHEPENVYKFLVLICGHFYSVNNSVSDSVWRSEFCWRWSSALEQLINLLVPYWHWTGEFKRLLSICLGLLIRGALWTGYSAPFANLLTYLLTYLARNSCNILNIAQHVTLCGSSSQTKLEVK